MRKRKTKLLDGIDKDILRVLYEKRPLPGRQIARKVGLTCSAVASRLDNLSFLGMIKKSEGKLRCFYRGESKVESPICIYWDLNLK